MSDTEVRMSDRGMAMPSARATAADAVNAVPVSSKAGIPIARAMEMPARAIAAIKRGTTPSHASIDPVWPSYVGQARAAIVAFLNEAAQFEKQKGWQAAKPNGLEREIANFKTALPGWWFSIGECQVSADASCGPTREAANFERLLCLDDRFNNGFHADLPQPATMAEALRSVRKEAVAAVKAAQGMETRSAETERLSAKGDSPVACDAPKGEHHD